jgi:hypothetical protein
MTRQNCYVCPISIGLRRNVVKSNRNVGSYNYGCNNLYIITTFAVYKVRISTTKSVHDSVRCHGGYVTCIWQSVKKKFLFILVIKLALFLTFAFCYFGINCPHSSLHWLTQCVLSSLFTALTHSVCIVLTLHYTDLLSVYCPHSSLHWITQCVLFSLFTALTHSVCIVLSLHYTDSLSVYCPQSSLHWFTRCVLSSVFTALTHSVCIVLSLHCTDSFSVYCPQSSLHWLTQCVLSSLFTALPHLVYTVLILHYTDSLSL